MTKIFFSLLQAVSTKLHEVIYLLCVAPVCLIFLRFRTQIYFFSRYSGSLPHSKYLEFEDCKSSIRVNRNVYTQKENLKELLESTWISIQYVLLQTLIKIHHRLGRYFRFENQKWPLRAIIWTHQLSPILAPCANVPSTTKWLGAPSCVMWENHWIKCSKFA